jgi:hypothetical protein
VPGAEVGCEHKHIQFIEIYVKAGAGVWNIVGRSSQRKNMMPVNKIGDSFFGK